MNKEVGSIDLLLKKYKRTKRILRFFILLLLLIMFLLIFSKENVLLTKYKLKGENKVAIKVDSKYKETGYIAKIYFINISKLIKVKSDLDITKSGEYKIKYSIKIKPLNINKELIRTVIVEDNVPPQLDIDAGEKMYIDMYSDFNIPSYSAMDNQDGDISDKVKIDSNVDTYSEGTYKVTFEVEDSCNNKTIKEIEVIVEPKYKHSHIVVDKSDQTMYYYERDNLIFSSPVVTGYGSNTPLGTYYINSKIYSAHLIGDDYETDVNYWMAFIGNSHGFHSAPWRSSFGGDIYLYNPSHGCVNLPTWAARELYYSAEIGTPVYIVE